jgi:hypothetical protein
MFIQCCMLLNDFNKNTRNFATYKTQYQYLFKNKFA